MDLEDRGRALEEGWFRANEKQLLKAARERREARLAEEQSAERAKLRDAHFMRCPKCGDALAEVELSGVKVDRCGHCEGVFFDAGELDELLVKGSAEQRGFFRRLTGLFGS